MDCVDGPDHINSTSFCKGFDLLKIWVEIDILKEWEASIVDLFYSFKIPMQLRKSTKPILNRLVLLSGIFFRKEIGA